MSIVNQSPALPYIVFDIDGTLANIKHRLPYIKSEKPDWDSFNESMDKDALNLPVAQIYYKMCDSRHNANHPSIFVTGRPQDYQHKTEQWLLRNKLVPNYLFMRPAGDYRSDVEIKTEIIDKYIKMAPILFVIDDRDKIVEMWRKLGYKCLQCQKGDY